MDTIGIFQSATEDRITVNKELGRRTLKVRGVEGKV
jgi:hypothetical protein